MKSKRRNSIIKIVSTFVIVFAATSLVPTQLITMDNYVLNIMFLAIVFLLLLTYFKDTLRSVISRTRNYEFGLIAISLLAHAFTIIYVLNANLAPEFPFDTAGASPLLMNDFFIWVKPIDILVQQILIVILVCKLFETKMSSMNITKLFVLGFGAIHLFQLLKTDLLIGLSFAAIAIILSVVFPNFILKIRNGYIYNYMIHLAIYDLAAILAWTLF